MLAGAHRVVLVRASGTETSTCKRCKAQFTPRSNHARACVYHPQLYTGGEVGKYTGFVPISPALEHRSRERGLVRFWDCCNALEEGAPGCCTGKHVSYDDTEA